MLYFDKCDTPPSTYIESGSVLKIFNLRHFLLKYVYKKLGQIENAQCYQQYALHSFIFGGLKSQADMVWSIKREWNTDRPSRDRLSEGRSCEILRIKKLIKPCVSINIEHAPLRLKYTSFTDYQALNATKYYKDWHVVAVMVINISLYT